MYLEAADVKFT